MVAVQRCQSSRVRWGDLGYEVELDDAEGEDSSGKSSIV